MTRGLQGCSTVLVRNGRIDQKAIDHESLKGEALMEVIHRQGFEHLYEVGRCELEPNGTFYVEAIEPSKADNQHEELVAKLESLTREFASLRAQMTGNS